MYNTKYTKRENKTIKKGIENKKTAEEITKELNLLNSPLRKRTSAGIRKKIDRMGLRFTNKQKVCKSCGCKILVNYAQQRYCSSCRGKIAKEKHNLNARISMTNPARIKKQRKYYKKWYKENGRKRRLDYAKAIKEWGIKHPEAVKAKILLHKAEKEGVVKRPKNCEECGREIKVNGHHPDYSKPLEVIWLCHSCHKLLHFQERNAT